MSQRPSMRSSRFGLALPIMALMFSYCIRFECIAQDDSALDSRQLATELSNLEMQDPKVLRTAKRDLLQQFEARPASQERCIAELFIAMMDEDHDAIKAAIETFAELKTELPDELRRTVGKLSLCTSIRESDSTRAETLYKSLVKGAMRDETPLASRRDMVRMVGFINGLFLVNESSPIPQDVLQRGELLLRNEKQGGLASTYSTSCEQGASRREFVSDQLEIWSAFTPEERVESLGTTRSELESTQSEYDEKLVATRIENTDQQTTFKAIFLSRKRMMAELAVVIDEQNTPTAGRPGKPPTPPRAPKKDSVHVDEYENKREKKGDKWETVRVRRDRDDIERERDRKFRDLQREYTKNKEQFDRFDQAYRQAMAAWVVRDQVRRQDLGNQRKDLEARITQVNQQQANLQIAKKDAMQELERLDERLDSLKKLASVQQCVDEAVSTKDVSLAYRASAWESIDFALEKNQLLRSLRSNDTPP